MAEFKAHFVAPILLLMLVVALEGATPPGIAKNPSHARCMIKKYKHCYNLEHVCPKFCPDSCTVECVSCKPICGPVPYPPKGGSTPPYSPPPYVHPPPTPSTPTPTPPSPPPTPSPPTHTPSSPPPPTPSPPPPTPSPPTPIPSSPPPPTPSTPPMSPPTPTPTPPTPSPPTPSTPPTTPPTPTPPMPSASTPYPPPPTPSPPPPPTPSTPTPTPSPPTPTPPTPTPSTPTPTPSPPTPTPPTPSEAASATAKCKNKYYPQCYNVKHVCPSSCPSGCEVDCVTCKPVCSCDRPGAVCQDPRFIGGDGITFYFHGKKDKDFCLVSDNNLHINAHFIGKRNSNMNRDFTWVQSIAILFDNHQIFLGALKTSAWNDAVDRLALSFDGMPVTLEQTDSATWQSTNDNVSITRVAETNAVVVKVDGKFKITAKVVPITEEDSRIHNYGITEDDCFAHLDLGFKFYSLSDEVNGILGQTYGPGHVTRVKMGEKMPVMGGDREFATSSLFAADCAVARFNGEDSSLMDLPMMSKNGK